MNDKVNVNDFEIENIFDLVNMCVNVNVNDRVKSYEIEKGNEYVKRLEVENRSDLVKEIEFVG